MCESVNRILSDEIKQFSEVFTCIEDGVIATDLKGCVVFMNEAAQNLTECIFSEMEGGHIDEILSIENSKDEEIYKNLVGEVIQTGKKAERNKEMVMITKNGKRCYVRISCSPFFNSEDEISGVVLNIRDNTEIHAMDEERISNQEKFKITFDMAPTAMVLVDEECKVKDINKGWKDLMSIEEMTVIGKRFGDGFRCVESLLRGCGKGKNCYLCKIRNTVSKVIQTGTPDFNNIIKHEFILNDQNISPWLKVSFIPVTIKRENCVLVTAEDISELM